MSGLSRLTRMTTTCRLRRRKKSCAISLLAGFRLTGIRTLKLNFMSNGMVNGDIAKLIDMAIEFNKAKEAEIAKIMKISGKKYSEAKSWLDKIIAVNSSPKSH